MWDGRHCRESEGSKVEMIWTRNKEMKESLSEILWNEEIRRYGMVDIAKKIRKQG